MVTITFNPLSASAYDALRHQMLSDFEGTKPFVYADSNGNATIGIGVEVSQNAAAILQGMHYSGHVLNELAGAITGATQGIHFATDSAAQEKWNRNATKHSAYCAGYFGK